MGPVDLEYAVEVGRVIVLVAAASAVAAATAVQCSRHGEMFCRIFSLPLSKKATQFSAQSLRVKFPHRICQKN